MHRSWALPTINTTYIRLQNHTNLIVGEHGIQTFKTVVVVVLLLLLSFDVFSPHMGTSLIIFEQVGCPNLLKYQFNLPKDVIHKSIR